MRWCVEVELEKTQCVKYMPIDLADDENLMSPIPALYTDKGNRIASRGCEARRSNRLPIEQFGANIASSQGELTL